MTKLSDIILRDTLANRPVAATAGRLYYATDEATLYRDSGSVWESVEGAASVPIVQTALSYTFGAASGSAYATKGVRVTPTVAMKLYGLCYMGTMVASGIYQAHVATISAGAIATLVSSASYTVAASGEDLGGKRHWLWFASPVALAAGTEFALMVSRTNGGDTYALPVETDVNARTPFGNKSVEAGYARVAKAAPVVGNAVDVLATGAMFLMGYVWSVDGKTG